MDFFRRLDPTVDWSGLDIAESPGVKARKRTDAEFVTYDGVNIPFPKESFDLVFTKQVFEHVLYPREVLREVGRVLKPQGLFVGSTSQLEPYHADSVWNYTPYGFKLMVEEAGLRLDELRPGIDGMTLILRRALRAPALMGRWFERESPLNRIIGVAGLLARKSHRFINLSKLVFCGQFCFVARKT